MVAPLLQSVTRQQPQQGAILDRSNRFAANAVAVLSAGLDINYVTGKLLSRGGTGYAKQPLVGGGLAWKYRKNFYMETESIPAIGTGSFVDFWVGYGNSNVGNAGNGTVYPQVATGGGSTANQGGIILSIGSNYGSANNALSSYWGTTLNWQGGGNQLVSAGEAFPVGELTVLVVVRRQTGLEMWRNGVLKLFYPTSVVTIPAQTFISGSFVNSTTWCSAHDTLLAGRSKFEPTAREIQAFSANPWQLFKNNSSLPLLDALMQTSGIPRKALYMDSNGVVRQSPGGLNVKPLALINGVLRPQITNETPVIMVNGQLRRLVAGETLVL